VTDQPGSAAPPTPKLAADRRVAPLVWLAIGLVALALRLWGLDARSVWLDEAVSLEVSRAPMLDILRGEVFDNHTPPLYYALLKLWLLSAPATAFWLRLPSALLDAANAVLLGLLATRALGSPGVGRAAALAYALSPYAIRLAQEARMYSLLMTCAIVAWGAAMLFLVERRRGALLASALAGIAGLYTHYYFAPFLAVLHGFVAVALWSRRRELAAWLACSLLIVLAFLPWLPVLADLLGTGQYFRRYSFAVLPYALFRFASGYSVLRLHWRERQSLLDGALEHLPVIAGVLGIATPLLLAGLWLAWRRSTAARSLVFLAIGMPLLTLLIDQVASSLSERYLAAVFPCFVVLVVLPISLAPAARGRRLMASLGAALLAVSLAAHLGRPAASTERWDLATSTIAAAEERAAPIWMTPRFYTRVVRYHLPDRRIIGVGWSVDCTLPERATPSDDTGSAVFWLLEVEALTHNADQLAACGYRIEPRGAWPDGNGLRLYLIERPARAGIGPADPGGVEGDR
jgi:hypothetical protein